MVLVLGRAAVGAVVLIPMTLLGLGVADVAAFNSRATSLEQSWRAARPTWPRPGPACETCGSAGSPR